jgi:hypothetical protein
VNYIDNHVIVHNKEIETLIYRIFTRVFLTEISLYLCQRAIEKPNFTRNQQRREKTTKASQSKSAAKNKRDIERYNFNIGRYIDALEQTLLI